MDTAPRRCAPGPGTAGEVRQRVERQVDLARRSAKLVAPDVGHELVGQVLGADHAHERQVRVDARRDDLARQVVAVVEHDADRGRVLDDDLRDARVRADLGAGFARGAGDGVGDRAGPSARESPRPERTIDLAHVVMEQHVGGPGRAHAEERADDARGGHRRLEHVGLEPLIEEVDGAHRHQLDLVVLVLVRERLEAAAEREQVHQATRIERRGVGRGHVQDRLDEPAHVDHGLAVLVVRLRVDLRMARDLAPRLRVIVDPPQIVAARHRRERAVEREDLEAVPRQVELPDDLRPQQRDDVGADRELEPRKHFLGDRGAAHQVPPLEHQHLAPGPRQVRGVDEPVVPAADDDHVIVRHWQF